MEIISEKIEDGVAERRFDLRVDDEVVPGIHWLPEKPAAAHPTVLIGHGGTQHKRVANVVGLAEKLVRERGYGVVALDAPGHGDRMTDEQRAAQRAAREARAAGTAAEASGTARRRTLGDAAPKAVKEWKALLDDLATNNAWRDGPFGYWGVSMGTSFGVPLIASEPRIKAAVLGLNALREGAGVGGAPPEGRASAMRENAEAITIPILFLFQWHDELMTRDAGVALWQAFGSAEKTMHINPGRHVQIPLFERDSAVRFYRRHLEP
jgi:dienelactone hydrolase